MALFSWFGDQEHRVFNYKPIYYDQDKEKYVPGAYIHGTFRDGNYTRKRGGNKAQIIIGLIGLFLVMIVLIYITKFYSLL